jgi:hypothetical protein
MQPILFNLVNDKSQNGCRRNLKSDLKKNSLFGFFLPDHLDIGLNGPTDDELCCRDTFYFRLSH